MNEQHLRLCSSAEWAEHIQTEVLPRLMNSVELGDDLLEIGPGFGAATDWLHSRVLHLTAVEMDPETARTLQQRYPDSNVTVSVGDCTATSFAHESFDSVASFTMLHHVETGPAQFAVLREALRVLRPNGVFFGSDSLGSNGLHHFHADDTYNPIDPARLLIQLQDAGFDEVTVSVGRGITFVARKAAPADESARN